NPWLPEEGASGSSAGPGAATAAGLIGFSIGSETGGSIVSPCMRCRNTGLRPSYGRVPRTGAMTLCWSLDKLGPMTRTVEDALLVLQASSGPDDGDLSSVPSHLDFDSTASTKGLRIGYFPAWMKEDPATAVDRAALDTLPKIGLVPVEVYLPNWPYNSLNLILFAEGAAAFEELTLSHRMDQLKVQTPDAWPNLFRQSRFLSAVDFVQAERLRRKVAQEMARIFSQVDVLLVPALRDEMLTISNFTGHPSLTLRAGFVEVDQARSDWAPDPANPLPKFSPKRRAARRQRPADDARPARHPGARPPRAGQHLLAQARPAARRHPARPGEQQGLLRADRQAARHPRGVPVLQEDVQRPALLHGAGEGIQGAALAHPAALPGQGHGELRGRDGGRDARVPRQAGRFRHVRSDADARAGGDECRRRVVPGQGFPPQPWRGV